MKHFFRALVAVILLMPTSAEAVVIVTEKTTGSDTSTVNSNTYTFTTAFTLTSGTLGICFVGNSALSATSGPTEVLQTGQTWTQTGTSIQETNTSVWFRLSAWRSVGQGASPAAVTVNFVAGQTGATLVCFEISGVATGGENGSSGIGVTGTSSCVPCSNGDHTVTLGSRTAGSVLLDAGFMAAGTTWTPEYANVLSYEPTYSSPLTEGKVQWDYSGSDNTPTWTLSGAEPSAGVLFAVEVLAIPGGITVSEKLSEATSDNLTAYTSTGTFSLATGSVGICFFGQSDADASDPPTSVTQTGQTWTKVSDGVDVVSTNYYRLSVWKSVGAGAAAATITADTGGADAQSGFIFLCYEVANANTVVQSGTGTCSSCTTLAATGLAARTTGSALLQGGLTSALVNWTKEYSFEGSEPNYALPYVEAKVQWNIEDADTTPTWTVSATPAVGTTVAVEVSNEEEEPPPPSGIKHMLLLGIGQK